MTRHLTREDRELWERLQKTVKPLRPEAHEAHEDAPEERVERERPATGGAGKGAAPKAERTSQKASATPPPPSELEERSRRRLARGLSEIDARIDLHGMRQERAFSRLIGLLRDSQAHGARVVLVITGKGREGGEGRGVLKQAVPMWLSRPEFRDLIVGFSEAGRRHGGSGALYVQLRRRHRLRSTAS